MCYNSTTSLITFSIGAMCFVYLMYHGITKKNNYDIFAGVITLLIALMQLVEFFIWRNQECSNINHYASLSIMMILYLQAIAFSTMGLLFFKPASSTLNSIVLFSIIPFTLFFCYLMFWLNDFILCTKPTENSCRLYWAPIKILTENDPSNTLGLVFYIFYFFLLAFGLGFYNCFFGKENPGAKLYPYRYSFLPISAIATVLLCIYTNGNFNLDIFGTYWCFIAVMFGIISSAHI